MLLMVIKIGNIIMWQICQTHKVILTYLSKPIFIQSFGTGHERFTLLFIQLMHMPIIPNTQYILVWYMYKTFFVKCIQRLFLFQLKGS